VFQTTTTTLSIKGYLKFERSRNNDNKKNNPHYIYRCIHIYTIATVVWHVAYVGSILYILHVIRNRNQRVHIILLCSSPISGETENKTREIREKERNEDRTHPPKKVFWDSCNFIIIFLRWRIDYWTLLDRYNLPSSEQSTALTLRDTNKYIC